MPENESKCVCCSCNSELAKTKFYKSYSNFYANSHLPICKECFGEKFKCYSSEYQSNKLAMQRMCMAFDVHFDEDLFDKCDTNDSTVLGNYFKRLNISQYKGKTFEDSLKSGFDFNGNRRLVKETRIAMVDKYGNEVTSDTDEIDPADIEKWGVGFDKVDYDVLQAHYKYLKTANPNCDSNQEIFVLDLCYIHMQKMKALRNGVVDDYNKLTESYRKSFNQAGLKTVDDMKTDDDCWSVWVDRVSQYTPEEFYKNKERYKDHDGFGEYYERFAVRPLRNIELGTQDRDYEFYVHEEE